MENWEDIANKSHALKYLWLDITGKPVKEMTRKTLQDPWIDTTKHALINWKIKQLEKEITKERHNLID